MERIRDFSRRLALPIWAAGLVITAVTLCPGRQVMGGADPFVTLGVQRPATPGPAPDLGLPSLEGGIIRIKDFRGKAVLLGFFTTT